MEVLGRRRQPRVYLNKIQIARVVTLIEEVHSRRRVAQMMNVNHSAISRAWIRHYYYYYYYYYYCKADSQVYKPNYESTKKDQLLILLILIARRLWKLD
jgi:hypothetical protein